MDLNIEPNMEQEQVENDSGLDAKYLTESSSALSNSCHETDEMNISNSSVDIPSQNTTVAETMDENKAAGHQDNWDLMFESGEKSTENENSGIGNADNSDVLIDLCSSQEVREQSNNEQIPVTGNNFEIDGENGELQDSVIIHSDVECHLFDNVGSYETQDNIVIQPNKDCEIEINTEKCPEIDSFDEKEEEIKNDDNIPVSIDSNQESENDECLQEPILVLPSDKSSTNPIMEKSLDSSQHSEFEDTFASNREMLIKDKMSEGESQMQDTVMVSSSISEVEFLNTAEDSNKGSDLTKSILEQNEPKEIAEVEADDLERKVEEKHVDLIEVEIVETPRTIKKKLVETIEHCVESMDNDDINEPEVNDASMKENDIHVSGQDFIKDYENVRDRSDYDKQEVQSENVEDPSSTEPCNEGLDTQTLIPSEEAVLVEMTINDHVKETVEQENDTQFQPDSLIRQNESDEITETKVKFDSSKQIDIKGAYFRECSRENDPTPSPVSEDAPSWNETHTAVKPIEPGQVRELEALYTEFESQVSDFLCFAESNLRSAQDGEEGHTEILRGEYLFYFPSSPNFLEKNSLYTTNPI